MQELLNDNRPLRWLKVLACLALLAGLGIGLLALFASLGVWFGWWDFRQGFSMLRIANSYGLGVAIGSAVVGVLIFAAARYFRVGGGVSLSGLGG